MYDLTTTEDDGMSEVWARECAVETLDEMGAGPSDEVPPPFDPNDYERAQEMCQRGEGAMLAGLLLFG